MYMTNSEIVRNYNSAKSKRTQIQILADLNMCSAAKIKEILISEGIELPSRKREVAPVQQKKTSKKVTEPKKEPEVVKEKKNELPPVILQAIFDKMDAIEKVIAHNKEIIEKHEEIIKELENEYMELVEYIK